MPYSNAYADFLEHWAGAEVDLSELNMVLDASETVLKGKFPQKDVTPSLIVDFAKVVMKQLHLRTGH